MSLEGGVKLKGATRDKAFVAFSFEELYSMYERFEQERIKKAQSIIGDRVIKPDHFVKFIVERTNYCPHKLVTSLSNYWMETIFLLDGEMGLTLPAAIKETPALFFEALAIVRQVREQVRKESKKE